MTANSASKTVNKEKRTGKMENENIINRTEEHARQALNAGKAEAEKIIDQKPALNALANKVEEKIKELPELDDSLTALPVMLDMLRSIASGEYTKPSTSTRLALIGALLYFVSPVDAIPDAIPRIGLEDDKGVISFSLRFLKDDMDAFTAWRDSQADRA